MENNNEGPSDDRPRDPVAGCLITTPVLGKRRTDVTDYKIAIKQARRTSMDRDLSTPRPKVEPAKKPKRTYPLSESSRYKEVMRLARRRFWEDFYKA
jgi:hypothetical protein